MVIAMNKINPQESYASIHLGANMTEVNASSIGSTTLVESIDPKSGIEKSGQIGFNRAKLIPNQTYIEAGIEKLTALCHAVGLEDKIVQATDIFRGMAASWGNKAVGDLSGWQSNVSDDGAPFEFSIAFKENRAELRILLETQGSEPTLESNWAAGIKLNEYLAERFDVSLDRFNQIQDLFVPSHPDANFAIWHSVCLFTDKEPAFKLYLNPQAKKKI